MPTRQTIAAGKIIELSLAEMGGIFYARRLKERHHKLLQKLKQHYGKPKKSVKDARKEWKDEGESFSKELLRMREE